MHKTAALLKRFAALVPDAPFPKAFTDLSGEVQMRLAQQDPELHAVMSGSATASLEASVLDGSFADAYQAPSQEQLNSARVQEILAQSPGGTKGYYSESGQYIQGTEANMSLMVELSTLDPVAFQQQELIRNPPQPADGALSAEAAARVNAGLAAARVESLNHNAGASI